MHYYQFNVADYRKDTAHLTPIEHYIYRTLIDWYYLDEKPIPHDTEWLLRRLRLRPADEETLLNVLSDFFDRRGNDWFHQRIEDGISEYKAHIEQTSRAGKASAEARANKRNADAQRSLNDNSTTVQQTINYKPETNKPNNKGTRLPKDWKAPVEYIEFCKQERPDLNADYVADEFRDYWISVAGAKGVKLDWFATWRNWVRNQRSQPTIKAKDDQAWRNDDVAMMKKARELGVNTTGKSRFEVIAAIDKKRGAV